MSASPHSALDHDPPAKNMENVALSIDLNAAQVLNISCRGDGRQRVIKVAQGKTPLILKCYGLKRTRLKTLIRQFGSLFIAQESSITARARHDTERDVLTLWQREGFDVPALYPLPELPREFSCCLAMEWIPGSTAADMLQDKRIPLEFKKEIIARYAGVWAKRHTRALELGEPRLLQANSTLYHVFVSGDRLVHFDFEIIFSRKKDLERLIRREIVGVLRSLASAAGEDLVPLLDTLLRAYPNLSYFRQVAQELACYGTVPAVGWTAIFHRLARKNKRYRKRQNLIKVLNQALNRQG